MARQRCLQVATALLLATLWVHPASHAAGAVPAPCQGVPMTSGQPDIDRSAPGTTFCLSGVHNWSLAPRSGDSFLGPATLDGGGSTAVAFRGAALNVTLAALTVQHYNPPDQHGAISPDLRASGWTMRDLDVGFNANAGINPGDHTTITGGRVHDNGQEGIGGGRVDTVTVDGVEIDHNNTHHVSCGYEAGGFKWVSNNVTVRNSRVHDNYCKGLWSDIDATGILIDHDQVYNNDAEGIFVEISGHAKVTNNTVWGNGNRTKAGGGCAWLWGGGITIASSTDVEVAGNTLTNNCNGVTGTQQNRPDGHPGLLQNLSVHNDTVSGPGQSGVAADNGANLSTRNIVFRDNQYLGGQRFCGYGC